MFDSNRFGIDTIRLRGPVHEVTEGLKAQRVKRHVDSTTGVITDTVTSELVAGSEAAIHVERWRTDQPEVSMEFSVPRVLRGDNRTPATPAEVHTAAERQYDAIGRHVTWLCPVDELTVTRIDIARDFTGVVNAQGLLARLAEVPGQRLRTSTHVSANGVGVETLIRRAERHVSRLYDRSAMYAARASSPGQTEADMLQHLADAEDGVVRYELELRREEASLRGIRSLRDLEDLPLEDISRRYFEDRCRFHVVVAGPEWKIRTAMEDARSLGVKMTPSLGLLALDFLGIESECGPRTLMKYRKLATQFGLAPADLLRPEVPPVRLDFDLGSAVAVDALAPAA